MKKILNINRHVIAFNKKNNKDEPVVSVKTYKENVYCHGAIIQDKRGNEVARVVYSPDKPQPCGATVWIATNTDNSIVTPIIR